MHYLDIYNTLKASLNYQDDYINAGGIQHIRNFSFCSDHCDLLSGSETENPLSGYDSGHETGILHDMLCIHDTEIKDNLAFRYHIFMPPHREKVDSVTLMLHGFNEKDWYKYLPWAKYIADHTGKAVILFPIAFHMNRAPQAWSDKHLMYEVSNRRRELFPDIIGSSLSNAAISTRIHAKPQRFIWSGLQSYYDIIQFITNIKAGKHPVIESGAQIDIFAYSIGAFLAEVLMMANHDGFFDRSRLVMFCGGPVFNRLSPVSRFILDSQANVNLYSYIVEHLESHLKTDEQLRHYLNERREGQVFRSMLNYGVMSDLREKALSNMSNRLLAVTLKQDTVVAPYEVANTLQGRFRDIPVPVKIFDLPYPYKHEDPFPALEKIKNEVDTSFENVFEPIINFLQ